MFGRKGAFGPIRAWPDNANIRSVKTKAREPREHLKAFERTEDGVFAVDDEEQIVFWNGAARRILGFRARDVLGRKCYEVIGDGPDYCGHTDCGPNCGVLQRARRGRGTESYDVMARTSAGSHRLLNISIVVLKGKSAKSTLAVHLFRDVSEARRSQLEVQRGLLEASQASGHRHGDPRGRLTPRESEVLRLLSTGLGNAKIAEVMGISATTVRNHIDHVLTKLGVHSKLEAVVYAARHRIV